MGVLGNDVSAAMFTERDPAEEAWTLLVDAGIPAAVITDPGTFATPVRFHVMVEREHLDRAQQVIAPVVEEALGPGSPGAQDP